MLFEDFSRNPQGETPTINNNRGGAFQDGTRSRYVVEIVVRIEAIMSSPWSSNGDNYCRRDHDDGSHLAIVVGRQMTVI